MGKEQMDIISLNDIETTSDVIRGFRGVDRTASARENHFADLLNMDSAMYPFVSPRRGRIRLSECGEVMGVLWGDALALVRAGDTYASLYYGGQDTGLLLTKGKKQLAAMGTRIVIFPDNKYYDTYDGASGSLEAFFTTADGVSVRGEMCRRDGTIITYTSSQTPPDEPLDGAVWCDTSQGAALKQYSRSSGMWTTLESVYVKISYPGIGTSFKSGDGVSLSGFEREEINGHFTLVDSGDDHIIITAVIDSELLQTAPVTVERTTPVMDFVTEWNNRLWGCRRGLDRDGNFVNEIYASKLGDPFNWNAFGGISTDSYAASVGSEGEFTGIAPFGGGILFFKERGVHRLRGSTPSSFSLTYSALPGIQKGCDRSASVVGGILYYKSRRGIMSYDGTLPVCVSDALGSGLFYEAVAAASSFEYLVYMKDSQGEGRIYVYNTSKGIWNIHSVGEIDDIFSVGECICIASEGHLWLVRGDEESLPSGFADDDVREEERVSWFLETGELGTHEGFVTKLQLRMRGERGCPIHIEVMTQGSDTWESAGSVTPAVRRTYTIPLILGKSDRVRVRISGEGDFCLYSIGRYTEEADF